MELLRRLESNFRLSNHEELFNDLLLTICVLILLASTFRNISCFSTYQILNQYFSKLGTCTSAKVGFLSAAINLAFVTEKFSGVVLKTPKWRNLTFNGIFCSF